VRSSSCGALLRLCEAICDYADCLCKLTPAWPSRALSQENIKLSAATFRPGRHFRLSRRRDPARVGVSHIVQVESSLLHCSGIDELSNEGTFRFRPTSCEQRQKHSNDPLPPRMCQFLFAKFYSNVDVSNSAETSPWIGCSGESWSHTLGTSTVKVRLRRWGSSASFYYWPEAPADQLPCLLRRALSFVRRLSVDFSHSRLGQPVNYRKG